MNIIICNTTIGQDAEGRYRLNDLHKAAGGESKHQPAFFVRRKETEELVAELLSSANPQTLNPINQVVGKGLQQGTYVVKELVYAYAMWISPKFHLHVIRAFDAMVTGASQPKPEPAPVGLPRPIGETVDAISKIFDMLNVCPTSRVGLSRRYFSKNVPDLLEVLPDYTVDSAVIVANSSDATLSLTALLEREGTSIKTPQANLKLQSLGLLEKVVTFGGHFWMVTEKGQRYGKNLSSDKGKAGSVQPHWYIRSGKELIALILG